MRLDVHAHYYPKEYIELLIKLGRTDINPRAAHSDDFTDRLARMDDAGIDRQILSPIGLDTIVTDQAGAKQAARCVNDAYAKVVKRYDGRFDGFGWVPLPYVSDAIEEVVYCLDSLNLAGIGLACSYQGRSLDDPEFEAFWSELNSRKALVYIHPVGGHSCCHWGMDKYTLNIMVGSPNQETVAASRLVYSGVVERYPNIRFLFAGCGGTLPLLYEVHENLLKDAFGPGLSLQGWVRDCALDPEDPMKAFRNFWYDSAAQDSDLLLNAAVSKFGADRIVLGSDSPHGSEKKAISHIDSCSAATAEERVQMRDTNAALLVYSGQEAAGERVRKN